MSFQIYGNEPLMKWREPNAYKRKNFTARRFIKFFLLVLACTIVIFALHPNRYSVKFFAICISLSLPISLMGFIGMWFGSGSHVGLMQDRIAIAAGKTSAASIYNEIESCDVYPDSYQGTKFSVLKLTMKKHDRILIISQITQFAVPDDGSVEMVLKILRDKGVKVVEHPSLS